VRVEAVPNGARIAVIDNGVGIAPDVMERLFSHGFTTRKSGHGFGLHSAALAAGELGGSLTASSDGQGRGATFQLTLPLKPPGEPA
jgi:signal transduction histidine kinase